ncbi:MAG: leucyl aminopeptidase [Actinomycetes bacterium]
MTSLRVSSTSLATVRTDAVVVGVASGTTGPELVGPATEVDTPLEGGLLAALSALGATGGLEEVTRIPTQGRLGAGVLAVVGLGKAPAEGTAFDPEILRRAAGAAMRALAGLRKVAIGLPCEDPAAVAAVAEGVLLGTYTFDRYRHLSAERAKAPVDSVTLVVPSPRERAVRSAVERAAVVAEAVNLARDLVNTPPNDLHPVELAQAAVDAAKALPIKVGVLDERALRRGGYGGIIGVGQGSANPPRLVTLTYRHPRATRRLALVGKGVTFDSGGLSLKPPASMPGMKADMSGAAAVIAAVTAIARLGVEIEVVGWAPMVENLPSGAAQRPSDVLTTYGGRTVEVLNTDAEGRLILADALVAAAADKPDLIVDAATLTGAALVALGRRTGAVMSNDDRTRDRVVDAATRAGEAMWAMPLPDELRASLDSPIADLANIGDRNGGMLVAGIFLREFVPATIPWAHLDIAGPAFNEEKPFGYTPKGGTGAAVRTFVKIAEDLADGRF